jgi:hypothetical protein
MAIPTTTSGDISLIGTNGTPPYNGIWSLPNNSISTGSVATLRNTLFYDYFHGPNGGVTVAFNGWGEGTGTSGTAGDCRIYGIPVRASNNYAMSDPAGLDYFYDNSTYLINFRATNNLPLPGPPFFYNNDVQISFQFGNPQTPILFAYASFNGNVPASSSVSNTSMSNIGSPLINNGFWSINVSTNPQFQGTGANQYTLDINGSRYFSQTLASGVNNVTYYYNSGTNTITTAPTMATYAIGFTNYIGFDVFVSFG